MAAMVCLFAAVLLAVVSGSLAGNCCSSGGTASTGTGEPGCDNECNPRDLPYYVTAALRETDPSNAANAAQYISQYLERRLYANTNLQFPVVVLDEFSDSASTLGSPLQGGLPFYEGNAMDDISLGEMEIGGSYMARKVFCSDEKERNAMVWWYNMRYARISDRTRESFETAAAHCVDAYSVHPALVSLDDIATCVKNNFSGINHGILVLRTSGASTSSQAPTTPRLPTWHNMAHLLNYRSRAGDITVFMLSL